MFDSEKDFQGKRQILNEYGRPQETYDYAQYKDMVRAANLLRSGALLQPPTDEKEAYQRANDVAMYRLIQNYADKDPVLKAKVAELPKDVQAFYKEEDVYFQVIGFNSEDHRCLRADMLQDAYAQPVQEKQAEAVKPMDAYQEIHNTVSKLQTAGVSLKDIGLALQAASKDVLLTMSKGNAR